MPLLWPFVLGRKGHGVLLETEHPYSAKRFSWRKVVQLKTDALEVFFHSRRYFSLIVFFFLV